MGMLGKAEQKLDKVVSLLEELVALFKAGLAAEVEYTKDDGTKTIAKTIIKEAKD